MIKTNPHWRKIQQRIYDKIIFANNQLAYPYPLEVTSMDRLTSVNMKNCPINMSFLIDVGLDGWVDSDGLNVWDWNT